jgi:integrase
VDAAITLFLRRADFQHLAPASQRLYRHVLDRFRGAFGPLHLVDCDLGWWEDLRNRHARAPIAWNMLRQRMIEVIKLYRRLHPELLPTNPLLETARLPVPQSDRNRAWPLPVLRQVLQAATPNFRSLIIAYLLTAQRGGDVTGWRRDQYDAHARTITMRQQKTREAMILHVPELLAEAIAAQPAQHPTRLLCTPRGLPWKLANAQETLARLLAQLDLPRLTLHGLRATGPTELKRQGMDNRKLREITGHTSDATLEIYLRGAGGFEARHEVAEALQAVFDPVVAAAADGKTRRFAGTTGRAARVKSGVKSGKSAAVDKLRKPAET